MEHKKNIRVNVLNDFAGTTVIVEEHVEGSAPPGLINWLEGIKSGMLTKDHHEFLNSLERPVNVFRLKVIVHSTIDVIVTHPVGGLDSPVLEVSIIDPLDIRHVTRIVKAVLRTLNSMDIQKNFDTVLVALVHEPLDLIMSTVHAPNVRSVGMSSPVANRQPDNLDLAVSQVLHNFSGDKGVPMSTHKLVAFFRAENFADGPAVSADTLRMSLAEETVEERRSNPGL